MTGYDWPSRRWTVTITIRQQLLLRPFSPPRQLQAYRRELKQLEREARDMPPHRSSCSSQSDLSISPTYSLISVPSPHISGVGAEHSDKMVRPCSSCFRLALGLSREMGASQRRLQQPCGSPALRLFGTSSSSTKNKAHAGASSPLFTCVSRSAWQSLLLHPNRRISSTSAQAQAANTADQATFASVVSSINASLDTSPAQAFLKYSDASPTPFHATAVSAALLEREGFVRLREQDAWDGKIEAGGKYL